MHLLQIDMDVGKHHAQHGVADRAKRARHNALTIATPRGWSASASPLQQRRGLRQVRPIKSARWCSWRHTDKLRIHCVWLDPIPETKSQPADTLKATTTPTTRVTTVTNTTIRQGIYRSLKNSMHHSVPGVAPACRLAAGTAPVGKQLAPLLSEEQLAPLSSHKQMFCGAG